MSQKTLPSTPISATPSLTFSHSRAGSRSDEEALTSPSRQSDYRRHVSLDYSPGLDVLDQYHVDIHQPRLRNVASMGRIRKGSLNRNVEWKSHQENMPHQDDSFFYQ